MPTWLQKPGFLAVTLARETPCIMQSEGAFAHIPYLANTT
jgi:hypothetical protein